MQFTPIHNFVAVKPEAVKDKTESGIFIPENARTTPDYAIVVAVGSGCKDLMKVGDRVLTVKGAGTPVVINKEDCLVLRCDENHSEILAVISEN